ncbi:MAG: hypothetical protein WCJ55_11790 [Chloroflexales bacterium]
MSLHDEALTIFRHLAEIGPRRAGSPQEATAAAFVNGRLRHAGMGVTTHPLLVSPRRRRLYAAAAAAGIFGALTALFLPLPSLVLALVAIMALALDATVGPLAPIGPRRASQSIIGTQAIAGGAGLAPRSPRWRVVILAPLDSPTVTSGLSALADPSLAAALARVIALALVGLAALAELVIPNRGWVLLVAPAATLLALQLAAALRGPRPTPHDRNLGALTAMVLATQHLLALEHVEVWAAAVGASSIDPGGIEDLLKIYPFEPERTLIIALEQLGCGQLCYNVDTRRAHQEIASMIALAATACQIVAVERPHAGGAWLTEPLRRRGLRAISVYGHSDSHEPAAACQAAAPLSEDAARLVAAIIEQLEDGG